MAEQFLSQDEIDALLDGPDQKAEPGEEDLGSGPRAYDLARQERIVRGRMPTLELLHERFARNLRVGVFNFMRRSPEISVSPITVGKYSAFINELAVPTNINVMAFRPLHGNALLIIEPKLVFSIIDILFGGSGKYATRIEGREFSATEQRIIQRTIELICREYKQAWDGIYPIDMQYLRSEMQPQFANIANPTEIVVTAKFDIDLGDTGGAIHLCVPYVVLEPIREILFSTLNANASSHDHSWLTVLSEEIRPAQVELIAHLGSTDITIGELINLKIGDILSIDLSPTATVKVGQVPVFEGKYGESSGRYAVRIDQILSAPPLKAGTPS